MLSDDIIGSPAEHIKKPVPFDSATDSTTNLLGNPLSALFSTQEVLGREGVRMEEVSVLLSEHFLC